MIVLYFAYGSNLHSDRMRSRVPRARALGPARLENARLVCNKLGRDGSPKANLELASTSHVWGALWSLPADGWPELDRAEAGYERVEITVQQEDTTRTAWTYRSQRLTTRLGLRADYKRWIVHGAREQGLPEAWISMLEMLPED